MGLNLSYTSDIETTIRDDDNEVNCGSREELFHTEDELSPLIQKVDSENDDTGDHNEEYTDNIEENTDNEDTFLDNSESC